MRVSVWPCGVFRSDATVHSLLRALCFRVFSPYRAGNCCRQCDLKNAMLRDADYNVNSPQVRLDRVCRCGEESLPSTRKVLTDSSIIHLLLHRFFDWHMALLDSVRASGAPFPSTSHTACKCVSHQAGMGHVRWRPDLVELPFQPFGLQPPLLCRSLTRVCAHIHACARAFTRVQQPMHWHIQERTCFSG
jgi:hypothetical protein